ncbi:MAG: sulfurtransferase [Rhodothermia bacterium]|nr:sulfurtransferase [Rhodothermia bacterium]
MFQTLITPEALYQHLGDPNWVILDDRHNLMNISEGRAQFIDAHILGAQFADLETDLSGLILRGKTGRHPLPDPNLLAQKLGEWGVDENVQVVAYDGFGGAFAARLWWLLQWLGHKKVAVLEGGWPAWIAKEYPISDVVEHRPKRLFTPYLRPELVADVQEVFQASQTHRLLDARTFDRYCGENEVIDPVAGHIPGALSRPFIESFALEPNTVIKNFKSVAFLRQELLQYENPVCYCGSGVTAAHLALSFVHAGLPMPKVYPGSWSEWVTDVNRPIKVGPNP